MTRYPELARLLALLQEEEPSVPAIRAAADQIDAAASREPTMLRRAHAVLGKTAVRFAIEPSETTEASFRAACRIVSTLDPLGDR